MTGPPTDVLLTEMGPFIRLAQKYQTKPMATAPEPSLTSYDNQVFLTYQQKRFQDETPKDVKEEIG